MKLNEIGSAAAGRTMRDRLRGLRQGTPHLRRQWRGRSEGRLGATGVGNSARQAPKHEVTRLRIRLRTRATGPFLVG